MWVKNDLISLVLRIVQRKVCKKVLTVLRTVLRTCYSLGRKARGFRENSPRWWVKLLLADKCQSD
ncbi:MAG: hypothetical protein D6742_00190 [Cyanobacteria bacterium J069]|nr:MAG: hypothetical protein D6742_00190 [Cyanobacteria bacterium J069]